MAGALPLAAVRYSAERLYALAKRQHLEVLRSILLVAQREPQSRLHHHSLNALHQWVGRITRYLQLVAVLLWGQLGK